jgi:hypothetical protein
MWSSKAMLHGGNSDYMVSHYEDTQYFIHAATE